MLIDIGGVVEHAVAWLLRENRLDMAAAPAMDGLAAALADLLPASERAEYDARLAKLIAAGAPQAFAARIAGIVFLTTAFEIADLATHTGQTVERAARCFYGIGARFALDELRAAGRRLPTETPWQKTAVEALIDDFYALQADLAERVLKAGDGAADPVAAWAQTRTAQLAPADTIAAELRAAPNPDLAMLVVAGRQLRQVLG